VTPAYAGSIPVAYLTRKQLPLLMSKENRMKQGYTHLVIVSDRSGSMGLNSSEYEGAINAFIKDQASADGDCTMTLVQFDHEYEVVFDFTNLSGNPPPVYVLSPRGMTALYNSVDRAIDETGKKLSAMSEEDRPELVVFVVCTDGFNNQEGPTQEQVAAKIKKQQDEFSWKFVFLGVDVSEAQGTGMGVDGNTSVGTSRGNVRAAYSMTSDKLKQMRGDVMRGVVSAQAASMTYSTIEREQLK